MKQALMHRLASDVVLGDGGYLMGLRLRGFVQAGGMTPEVVVNHPDAVRQMSREFVDAGSEVLQTLTFFGTRNMMERAGLGDRVEEINRTAVRIAKDTAGVETLVAGNLCSPTIVTKDFVPGDGRARRHVTGLLSEQLEWILDEGVDFLILETFSFLEEAILALKLSKTQSTLPIVVTISFEGEGLRRTLDGFGPAECARRLCDAGADVVGVNCLCAPNQMLLLAREMQGAATTPVAIQPSAYHTWWKDVTAPLPPRLFADYATEARARGMRYIGACCGAGPEHIRAMAQALGRPTRT